MSNRLTFSLASLILIFAFLAAPVWAAAPQVTSITAVDIKVGTDTPPADSTVKGNSVLLVDSPNGNPPVVITYDGTNDGQFQVEITFDQDVYNASTSNVLAADDLAAADLNTLALQGKTTFPNLIGANTDTDVHVSGVTRKVTATSPSIVYSKRTFVVTFTVPNDHNDADDLPLHVWVGVQADKVFSLNAYIDQTLVPGEGNDALENADLIKFSVVESLMTLTPLSVEVRPPSALNDVGKAEFKLVFNKVLSTDLNNLVLSDLRILGADADVASVLSDPEAGTGTDAGKQIYTLTVTPADPTGSIAVTLKANSVADGDGLIGPAQAVNGVFRPGRIQPLTFGARKATSLAMCEDDTTTGAGTELPLAFGPESGTKIEYLLTPALPEGFDWDTTDNQDRVIRRTGKKAKAGKTTHTWTAVTTTESASVSFTIDVKAHQLPKQPTGLTATKLDSDDTGTTTKNRVELTWTQPGDLSGYSDCIPFPANYVVYVTKQNELTGQFPTDPTITYTSVPKSATVKSDDEDHFTRNTAGVATHFTEQFLKGVYKFQIAAHNVSKLNTNENGAGTGPKSLDATWAVTGGMQVVVADPPSWDPDPARDADLDAAIDRDRNSVTLNWLKVPDGLEGGAPIDDSEQATRTKYYGPNVTKRFGGYVVYRVNYNTKEATKLPKDKDFVDDSRRADGVNFYAHPTYRDTEIPAGQYVYRVTAMNIAGESERSISTKIITIVSGTTTPTTPNEVTEIPGKGHVIFVRDIDNAPQFGTSRPDVAEWSGMPNLYALFRQSGGGTLQLNVAGKTARQLVFSEVMWAVDEGKFGQNSYTGQQWIEVHNTTDTAVPISTITFATKEGRPALAEGTDRISNVVGAGNDWIKTGKGQNGNSTPGSLKEFRSMYRSNNNDGSNPGHWTESTLIYHPNYKGTPGKGEPKGPAVIGTDTVPRSPIIFNEISNNTNANHEWIELRNVSGGNVNLKNYEVTMLTSKGANQDSHNDVDLIDFTTADRNVPAGEVVLIVKSDPTGDPSHPLAAGWNFGATGNWTVATSGSNYVPGVNADSPRYIVAHSFGNMPDDGNFVLVLRNRQDRNGSTGDANIRDIAGYVPNNGLKVENAKTFTHLWPLSNFAAPSWSNNNLAAGTVQRRQAPEKDGTGTRDKNQNDKTAFRDDDNGWTGIGYKRNAAATAQNGGTPGYKHGVLHSNDDDANKAVIISEIMPTTGDRNLPEWIELRNLSKTIGVNVDNWRLTITNHDSDGAEGTYVGDLTHTITISGRIPPGQTYLVVARNGRNTTNLPSERIHNVGRSRIQPLLNPYGFEIKLESKKDNNYLQVDTVGNLGKADGRGSRSFTDIAWDMPATTDESGNRISIVRAPMNGEPMVGTEAGAWKSFEGSKQSTQIRELTYYGDRDDYGSPGHTAGGVLPVSLSKFRPERLATGEVSVRWVTESETNNAGFNILRGEALDGEFTKLNTQLIKGQGTTSERTGYEFVDKSAKPNVIYYYQIQDVSLDGEVVTLRTTHLRGNISVVGKLTTTWGELKALQ